MRVPFNGSYSISQKFNDPCCRASYAQFGMKGHNGIDYALPLGTQVVAAESGTARVLSDPGGFGNYVEITGQHKTIYAHLKGFNINNGVRVNEGQVIGLSGNTGNSSGPHLHFGVKPIPQNNNNGFLGAIDPQPIINKGEDVITKEQADSMFVELIGRHATPEELKHFTGMPFWEAFTALSGKNPEHIKYTNKDKPTPEQANNMYFQLIERDGTKEEIANGVKVGWWPLFQGLTGKNPDFVGNKIKNEYELINYPVYKEKK